ncbi:hypothetical protein XI09_10210, partial [Bradyrhizobium sp. CCBAU 11386]|nr:hypothetical protein [Bradyrhizobium sp. CCBAU 11386]
MEVRTWASGVMSPERIWGNVMLAAAVFVAVAAIAQFPDIFDKPVTGAFNQLVGRWKTFDRLVFAVFSYPTYSGVILTAAIWSCWFATDTDEPRSRILIGLASAYCAGTISRMLQHLLSIHPRPFYDRTINFRIPAELEQSLNTWNSFPSDHVTVFAALVTLAYIVRYKWTFWLAIFTAIVELPRIYVGAHYPSDLIAGAALGAMAIWLAQSLPVLSFCSPALNWERRSPAYFYPVAFFVSYQVATLFADIRLRIPMISPGCTDLIS